MNLVNEYILEHHGIEGQHWGVRNGPPYPLERTRSAARKYQREANKINKEIAKSGYRFGRIARKANRKAKRNSDITRYVLEGKKELDLQKHLELKQQKIIKNAKSEGYTITNKAVLYDGIDWFKSKPVIFSEKMFIKNLDPMMNNSAGGYVIRPKYKIKV